MFKIVTESIKSKPFGQVPSDITNILDNENFWISSDYHLFRNWDKNDRILHPLLAVPNKWYEMHQRIVKPNDWFLFLGDMSESEVEDYPEEFDILKRMVTKLNGRKILVLGNNDTLPYQFWLDCGFEYVVGHMGEVLISEKRKVIFSHFPFDVDSPKYKGYINMHGHLHTRETRYWNMNSERHINCGPMFDDQAILKYEDYIANYKDGFYKNKSESATAPVFKYNHQWIGEECRKYVYG